MSIVASLARTWRRQSTALLDGDFPWGAVISSASRYGASQQRFIVYPPGITLDDRRWLRAWRGFPIWGAALGLLLYVELLVVMAPPPAMAIALSVLTVAGSAAFVKAAHTRRQVRTLNACVFSAVDDRELLRGQRQLRLLATTLLTAHAHHERGEMSTVDYEHIWWRVYDALAPDLEPPCDARRHNQHH